MEKKPIRAARCKHMPTKDNTVVIFSSKHGNVYQAGFTIGNQDFTVAERETKKEAKWFCDMLEVAFKTLAKPKYIGLRNEENIKMYEETAGVKITIINKK